MRSGVFSNVWSTAQGGGVLYIAAWAAALRAWGPVDLYCPGALAAPAVAARYAVDLSRVAIHNGPAGPAARGPGGLYWGDRGYDLVLRQATRVPGPSLSRRAVLLTEFPMQRQLTWRERAYLRSYRAVVANSAFTAGWIARRWGRAAISIPPPVAPVAAAAKEPAIIAVGRFTGGQRGKRQLELVRAFRALQASVADWTLHLCGVVEQDGEAYFAEVQAAAAGLPVCFHTNVTRAELETRMGRASVFWHATGCDAGPDEPELLEHFGISTVEAMSAGCVPVVIGRGGQVEAAGPDLAAWTWQTLPECVEKTARLAADPALRAQLGQAAQAQAAAFAPAAFRRRVADLLSTLGISTTESESDGTL